MISQISEPIGVEFKGKKYYLDLGSSLEPITLSPKKTAGTYQVDDDDSNENPYFVIYVTDYCNMKCSYCFNAMDKNTENYNKQPLYNIEEFRSFVHENYQGKEIGIRFFGGEPLINKDWIYVFVKEMEKENIKIHYDIFTNATLLDNEFLDFAEQYKIRFYVSINGGVDKYKGGYYKEEIWKGIRSLRARDFHVITRMVWTPNSQETLVDLVKQAVENEVKTVSVTLPWGMEFDYDCFSVQLEEFAEFYLKNILDHNFRYIGVAPFVSYISKWSLGKIYNSSFCAAGKSMISVATDGTCYPCHCFTNIKEYCSGNIYEKVRPLFPDMNADTLEPCKSCKIRYFCKAKCAADGYFANGKPYRMNLNKCKTEYQIIGASAYILYEMQQRKREYAAFRSLLTRVEHQYNNS